MAPKIRAVGQGLVVHFEYRITDRIQIGHFRSERGILREFHQTGRTVGDPEFLRRAAHSAGNHARDLRFFDRHSNNGRAQRCKRDLHAFPDIRCSAHAVLFMVSCIQCYKVQFFRIGMRFNLGHFGDDNPVHFGAHFINFLYLRSRKRKAVDQIIQIQSGKIHIIGNPVH